MLKFRSKNKFLLTILISICFISVVIATKNFWIDIIQLSQDQLNDPDYNRNKSLYYYLFIYSPNLFCYIFGNGYPSGGNSPLGNLMWDNFKEGIFSSDMGMIGMWTDYGIIPIITIYSVLFMILFKFFNKKLVFIFKFNSLVKEKYSKF